MFSLTIFVPFGISQAQDSTKLQFPIPKESYDGKSTSPKGLQGKETNAYKTEIKYDPLTGQYSVQRAAGGLNLGGSSMNLDEFSKYTLDKSLKNYWQTRADAQNGTSSRKTLMDLVPKFKFDSDDILGNLFGGDLLKMKVNLSAEILLGGIYNRRDDPALDVKKQRIFNFDFDAKIEANADIKIGNKFDIKMNHNTEALFAFDNKFKTQYDGKEDDIIKLVQLGNVDMSLPTTLIQGSQNLFGIKTKLQFGNTFITGVFSEQRSEAKTIQVQGGAQTTPINFKADNYEEDRHFFIAHYFRKNYHNAIKTLPIVNSNINIIKIEVWVTNIGSPVTNNRNIVAFTDLGENEPVNNNLYTNGKNMPDNNSNNILDYVGINNIRDINSVGNFLNSIGFVSGDDYVKLENARLLMPSEYTFNSKLGFISLNTRLNSDQVLAVAYQYQLIGDETVYQVGEFSDAGLNAPNALAVKLLKSSSLNTQSPLWRLMMKNIYNLNAYQISNDDFRLNIVYAGDEQGVMTGYFKDGPKNGIPLLRLFGMDELDAQQNKEYDGMFDWVDNALKAGGLIESATGRIVLPYTEPFGRDLIEIFDGDSVAASKYMFSELYDKTKTEAQNYPKNNKYYFDGSFKSSSSNEIMLGSMNVPQGSVKVMAGNMPLTENVDYTVDYVLGRVKIINEGILNSGTPISVSCENNAMFNIMTKRMIGLRAEHIFDKHFQIGATFQNLHQTPLTQKVNIGEEPVSNSIWGFDISYDNESRILTSLLDKILPFEKSKTISKINLYGEFAHFVPGFSKAIGNDGTIYIDDFEASKSSFNLKDNYSWYLASTPQWQRDLFPESYESLETNALRTGFNRAKLAWYIIDRTVFYNVGDRPKNISSEDLSDPYSREVLISEIFPKRQIESGYNSTQSTLNLAFYPSEKGPYNYDVNPSPISAGINSEGFLEKPITRWGGIMRKIDNTDFEANNVEYIEFWLMDPFINKDGITQNTNSNGGYLYFNLGDVSEDVLRDGRKSFEHGLPINKEENDNKIGVSPSPWGYVPAEQAVVNAFNTDPNSRQYQDVGYDGLDDENEREFFESYLIDIMNKCTFAAYTKAIEDPSNDNYHYYRGNDLDQITTGRKILDRYKNYSNPQGNSPSSTQTNGESYSTQQTNFPNTEDINNDNTLNESENYFQYEVKLHPNTMKVGINHITDIQTSHVKLKNGTETSVNWYQFKIPVRSPDKVIGSIQNFQSIRFIRMFLKGFEEETFLRFATLEFVKSEWRKYNGNLHDNNAYITSEPSSNTECNISVVNIEENSNREPIPYVVPPGIEREINYGSTNLTRMNEQALSIKVTNLNDGDARAIYKITDYDIRQFKNIKMFIHAEKVFENDNMNTGDMTVFIRLGADFEDNYYEYEVPLTFTPWNRSARSDVWPELNNVNINLEEFVTLKTERNTEIRQANSKMSYTTPYIKNINGKKYTIVGNPSISAIKVMLIGVRNPKKRYLSDDDNGRTMSAEIWLNELRVSEMITNSGFAATGRVQATLGDVGNVNASGSYTSANFNSLETRITDLQQDNVLSYDLSTNLELGRFLPEKTGLKLPFHYDYSRSLNNPEYNPLDPDIKTANDIKTYSIPEEREAVKHKIQDQVVRQNLNFMNVRKEYKGKDDKRHFYDIENFNASYSYSAVKTRNIDLEYDNRINHKGSLGYNFTLPSLIIEPFKITSKGVKQSKTWAIFTDFNFSPLPKSFAFNTEMNRQYNEAKIQNKSLSDIIIEPTFYKKFDWARNYDLKWDLTKSINISYQAGAISYVEEPRGKIDTKEDRDSIWHSILQLGRLSNYNQTTNVSWKIPINKIPILDWVSASASYNTMYRWNKGPNAYPSIGNTIENTNTIGGRADLDFVKLYNKVPFLRAINQPSRKKVAQRKPNSTPRRPGQQEEKKEEKPAITWDDVINTTYKGFFRMLMMVRTAGIEYSQNSGMLLPGYMDEPDLLGTSLNTGMPGLPFAFGSQKDIKEKLAMNNFMSTDSMQNSMFEQKSNNIITANMVVEPFANFRIQLNANRTASENYTEFYKYNTKTNSFGHFSPQLGGNYSISIIALKTSFSKNDKQNNNDIFQSFLDNRYTIAQRYAEQNPYSIGQGVTDSLTGIVYPYGYGPYSQDVLIASFIATYTGQSPNNIKLSAFPKIPLPNWNLSYDFAKMKFLEKIFNRLSIRHGYNSNYTVGGYARNVNFVSDDDGFPIGLDLSDNFIDEKLYSQIVISESFSPLIKFDIETKNNIQFNIEWKKSRMLALSFSNNQLTESNTEDLIFGTGYVFKNVGFNIIAGNSKRKIESDLNLHANVSIRSNVTVLRRIDQNSNIPSAGSTITSINLQADYKLSEMFTIRLFYDQVMTTPKLTTLVYTATTHGGISLKMTFNQ
ncbi:cell surface protein SprA [Bacteroidia bacterium]|nr:cell surface protein SprA [Bacteroidia bacterium]